MSANRIVENIAAARSERQFRVSAGRICITLEDCSVLPLRPSSMATLALTDEEIRLIQDPPRDEEGMRRSYAAFQQWEALNRYYYNLANPPDAGDL